MRPGIGAGMVGGNKLLEIAHTGPGPHWQLRPGFTRPTCVDAMHVILSVRFPSEFHIP